MSNYISITKESSPSICPLPFMHTYITANGSLVPCCEAQETKMGTVEQSFMDRWNGRDYLHLRKQLIAGNYPEACRKCWNNEKQGLSSNRQDMWKNLESGDWGSSSILIPTDLIIDETPRFLELKSSNLCNLKCKMCHPSSSHRIIEDIEIIEKYRKNLPWKNKIQKSTATVNDLLSDKRTFTNNLKILQFSGGEPLISDDHFRIINTLIENGAEKYHLRYSTNLTVLEHDGMKFLEIWSKFKKVNIKISMDGLGDVYNYIRVNADFEKVMENIHLLKEKASDNMTFSIGFTTQAYNVFQLPDFLNFFEKIIDRNAISTHILHTPELLSPAIYPQTIKNKIIHKIQTQRSDLKELGRYLENKSFSEEMWINFLSYTHEFEKKYPETTCFHELLERSLGATI